MAHGVLPHEGRHVRILVRRILLYYCRRAHVRCHGPGFLLRGRLILLRFLVYVQLLLVDLESVIRDRLISLFAFVAVTGRKLDHA